MPHPLEYVAVKSFFCFNLDCKITCYLIVSQTILLIFALCTNFGIDHWTVILFSLLNFFLHFIAAILLLLGTVWDRNGLKIAYCWLLLICLFSEVTGLVLYLVYRKEVFLLHDVLWNYMGILWVIIDTIIMLLWDIYSTMMVFGNLCEVQCCVYG